MLAAEHIISAMWPWEAFNWGVFWAILAAGVIYLAIANLTGFHVLMDRWLYSLPCATLDRTSTNLTAAL